MTKAELLNAIAYASPKATILMLLEDGNHSTILIVDAVSRDPVDDGVDDTILLIWKVPDDYKQH